MVVIALLILALLYLLIACITYAASMKLLGKPHKYDVGERKFSCFFWPVGIPIYVVGVCFEGIAKLMDWVGEQSSKERDDG